MHYGDLSDSSNITRIIQEVQPDEIYNLGAQSHVGISFETPEYTSDIDALGTLRVLEAIRLLGFSNKTKFYQASTSELYGLSQETPQKESTPFYPRSPYAVAKLYAHWITINYREAYGMYACNGILFNHESPRRGETFVTRKVTIGISKIIHGLERCLHLGNLYSLRDWGHAKDYVEMCWKVLQNKKPDDFVIATGVGTTVRDLVKMAFSEVGIELEYRGEGESEVGVVVNTRAEGGNMDVGKEVVKIDSAYFRPSEVDTLIGDASKAKLKLGWKPKTSLRELLAEMVTADYATILSKN